MISISISISIVRLSELGASISLLRLHNALLVVPPATAVLPLVLLGARGRTQW